LFTLLPLIGLCETRESVGASVYAQAAQEFLNGINVRFNINRQASDPEMRARKA
jgi:hypothetical protein